MGFGEVVCLGIIELKVLFIVEERQVEPLPSFRFHRVDHVLDASPDEDSIIRKCIGTIFARGRKCHLLRVNLVALDDRMLFLVAPVADIKVEIADEVGALAVDDPQAVLELLVALAVEAREEVVVLEAVLLLARRDVVAVIVLPAALVHLLVAAEVFVAVGGVARSAPLSARETQIDSFLGLPVPLNRRLAHFGVGSKRSLAA